MMYILYAIVWFRTEQCHSIARENRSVVMFSKCLPDTRTQYSELVNTKLTSVEFFFSNLRPVIWNGKRNLSTD